MRMPGDELLQFRMLAAGQLQFVADRLALAHRHRAHPEGELGTMPGMLDHGAGDGLGLDRIAVTVAAIETTVRQVVEAQPRLGTLPVRAGHDEQLALVEFLVGHGDQRLVAAAVVPLQHALRKSLGRTQRQHAFQVPGLRPRLLLIDLLATGQAGEERGRWQLLVIAHHHDLPAARDRAQRIHRLDLAGFVDDQQVELDGAGLQELGHRQRAHHEHRFDGLDRRGAQAEQAPQRHVVALARDLAAQRAQRTYATGGAARQAGMVRLRRLDLGQRQALAIPVAEPGDQRFMPAAIKGRQFRVRPGGQRQHLQVERAAEQRLRGGRVLTAASGQGHRFLQPGIDATAGHVGVPQPGHQPVHVMRPARAGLVQQRQRHLLQRRAAEGLAQVHLQPLHHLIQRSPQPGAGLPGLPGRLGQAVGAFQPGGQRAHVHAAHRFGVLHPGQDGIGHRPVGALALPHRPERGARGRIDACQHLARPARSDEIVEQRQPCLRGLGQRPLADAAHLVERLAVGAVEEAQQALAVRGDEQALGQPVAHPGHVGHLRPALRDDRRQRAPLLQAIAQRGQSGAPHPGRNRVAVERRRSGQGIGHLALLRQRGQAGGRRHAQARAERRGRSASLPHGRGQGRRARHQVFGLGAHHRRVANASPRVRLGPADPRQVPAQLAQQQRTPFQFAGRPRTGRVQPVRRTTGAGQLAGQHAEDVERSQPGVAHRRVHALRVQVELRAQLLQLLHAGGHVDRRRLAQLQGPAQFLQHGALVGLVAVQLQAQRPQPDVLQPPLDHLQCRHLLRDEQHLAPIAHRSGDQVGDRLRLARARRALDDQVVTASHAFDGQCLRAVAVHDVLELGGRDERIQEARARARQRAVIGVKAIAEQAGHQTVAVDLLALGPLFRVQIEKHQQLGEREEPQLQCVVEHAPLRLGRNAFAHRRQIGGDVELVGVREGRHHDTEVGAQLLAQRQVLLRLLIGPAQHESITRALALQHHRQQHQRRMPVFLRRGTGLAERQLAHRQVQHVHALLFEHGAVLVVHVQQPLLQVLRAQPGLQARIQMVFGQRAGSRVFLARLRQGQGVIGRFAGAVGQRFLGLVLAQGRKGHARLVQQRLQGGYAPFVMDDDAAAGGLARQVQQSVAVGQVEQNPALRLQRVPDAHRGCSIADPRHDAMHGQVGRRRLPRSAWPTPPGTRRRRLNAGRRRRAALLTSTILQV
ncbi:hypothetical protein D3C71_795150 [compost metagenome]